MSEAELMGNAGGALTKGSLPPRGAPVRFGDFTLDLDGCSLSNTNGGDIPLTQSEFALLCEFIRHPGRVLSREYLLDALWLGSGPIHSIAASTCWSAGCAARSSPPRSRRVSS
jgi:DNA-binding response OmpR family regulator